MMQTISSRMTRGAGHDRNASASMLFVLVVLCFGAIVLFTDSSNSVADYNIVAKTTARQNAPDVVMKPEMASPTATVVQAATVAVSTALNSAASAVGSTNNTVPAVPMESAAKDGGSKIVVDAVEEEGTILDTGLLGFLFIYIKVYIWLLLLSCMASCGVQAYRAYNMASTVRGAITLLINNHRDMLRGNSNSAGQRHDHRVSSRGDARAAQLRLALAFTGRDFSPEDYDMLQELDRENANWSQGLEEGTIRRYPVRSITQADIDRHLRKTAETRERSASSNDNSKEADDEFACSVCLAPYEIGDDVRTISCLHSYHVDCIDPWLREHALCPICKMECE